MIQHIKTMTLATLIVAVSLTKSFATDGGDSKTAALLQPIDVTAQPPS